MKKYLLVSAIVWAGLTHLNAQTYPSWDDSHPGPLPFVGAVDGNNNCVSTNAVFCIANGAPDPYPIYRWTRCGGWEQLTNCTIDAQLVGRQYIHANRRMLVHDHYLYVTGLLCIGASTNAVPLARFDLNTGFWSGLGAGMDLSYRTPYTIAIDSSNRIYLGFYEHDVGDGNPGFDSMTGYAGQTVTNLLIVSTNNGSNWDTVGGGLTVETLAASGFVAPAITALYADGTNLYIGGDFTSAAGQLPNSSKRVIMWTGNAWRNLDGVYCASQFNGHGTGPGTGDDALAFNGYNFNLDSVNSIVGIGTNIYVAGVFDTPQMGIARFSNVTGQSLPIDGLLDNNLFTWGSSLAVNNGHLYLAGTFVAPNGSSNYVCLLDPEVSHPSLWSNAFPSSIDGSFGVELSSLPNANAVYVVADNSDFKRLMVGEDGPSPSAQITKLTNGILVATGTAGGHWHVIFSDDNTNWAEAGAITLWSGTGVMDLRAYNPLPPYWKLTNYCSASSTFNFWRDINVQFPASSGQATRTGAAATGSDGDYWNRAGVLDGEESPIGDPGSTTYQQISCLDNLQVPTGVTINLGTLGDPPMGVAAGAGSGSYAAATDPLMLGFDTSGSGDTMTVTINGLDPRGTYDIYFYGLWQDSTSRKHTQFQLVTGLPDATTSSSNPQLTDSGTSWDINTWQLGKQYTLFHVSFTSPNSGSTRNVRFNVGTFGTFAILNGMQIVRTN